MRLVVEPRDIDLLSSLQFMDRHLLQEWRLVESLFPPRLSELSLEDQEQGDSSACDRAKKLHDPLGHRF